MREGVREGMRKGGEGWQEDQVKIEQIGGSANGENSAKNAEMLEREMNVYYQLYTHSNLSALC